MARLFDDASNERLDYSSDIPSSYPYAVSCWFRTDDNTVEQTMLGVGNTGVTNQFDQLQIDNASAQLVCGTKNGGTWRGAYSTTTMSNDTWHHCIGIWVTDTDRRVLLDGGGKDTETIGLARPTMNITTIAAVNLNGSYWNYVSGSIAEMAIYNLSAWPGATDSDKADEFERVAVAALAAGYSPPHIPLGLIAYWPLIRDEDQDRVGGYDMLPTNTPSISAHPPIFYPAMVHQGFAAVAAANAMPMAAYLYRQRRV